MVSVPDDPFYLPNRPLPARKPRPAELLWTVRKDAHELACELRYHGEYGVEAQLLKDGDLLIARRFDTRALAIQWAEGERLAWLQQ